MSLAATLDDLSFPELLHLLSFNKRSGKLILTTRDHHAVLVFRRGHVVQATSTPLRESFGSLLLQRGLVTERDLHAALERQDPEGAERRLAAALVEAGRLSPSEIYETVRQQIVQVMAEVFQWKTGFFRLDRVTAEEGGPLAGESSRRLVGAGFDPEALLFEAVTSLDTPPAEGPWRAFAGAAPGETGPGLLHVPPEWEAPGTPPTVSLGSLVAEIQSPAFAGEIALALLRYASLVVGRGVFFAVRGNEACAVGLFGLDESAARALRRAGEIKVPLSQPSLLSQVVDRRQVWRGPLAPHAWNQRLVQMLGGQEPGEVVALPLVLARRAEFVFYGDDLPDRKRIGRLDGLEYLMSEAGLAMERLALEHDRG
jgi:hypothetical protein